MSNEMQALRGELLAWQAMAKEAIKLLTPDQLAQVIRFANPGLQRIADPEARAAAAKVLAAVSRGTL